MGVGVGDKQGPAKSQPLLVRLVKRTKEVGFDPEGKGEFSGEEYRDYICILESWENGR